jgi:hypothetical protein
LGKDRAFGYALGEGSAEEFPDQLDQPTSCIAGMTSYQWRRSQVQLHVGAETQA